MEKRIMTFIACLFLSIGMALAQTHVSGQVTSAEDGEPIIGASVKVVGSKTAGAVTDINGNFSINAPAGAQLEITYVGMEKKTVKASNNMKIVLNNDNQSLGEVVVTGYGSARKLGTIAGSVETVSGKTLQNRPVANVADALQGQVAGLQVLTSSGEPSSTASMRIRGVTSINASTEPLYILDGSEISQNTFLSINPNDIESMTVLKDASSTAIYGSRAANGVVIVTSKKGKFGEAPTVSISAQYGISSMVQSNIDVMNSEQWLNFQEMLDPSLKESANFQAEKAYYKKYGISTDWKKEFFKGSKPTTQIDASVRGGGQNLAYLLIIIYTTKIRKDFLKSKYFAV
jgi:TonB-linked SusC/RagA family outer membrane protein